MVLRAIFYEDGTPIIEIRDEDPQHFIERVSKQYSKLILGFDVSGFTETELERKWGYTKDQVERITRITEPQFMEQRRRKTDLYEFLIARIVLKTIHAGGLEQMEKTLQRLTRGKYILSRIVD